MKQQIEEIAWIPVAEAKPPYAQRILITDDLQEIVAGELSHEDRDGLHFVCAYDKSGYDFEGVTHWAWVFGPASAAALVDAEMPRIADRALPIADRWAREVVESEAHHGDGDALVTLSEGGEIGCRIEATSGDFQNAVAWLVERGLAELGGVEHPTIKLLKGER